MAMATVTDRLLTSKLSSESNNSEKRLATVSALLAMAYAVVNKPVPEVSVLKVIARDLISQFTDEQINAAIKRTMRECEWITLKVILERIPGVGVEDGRPEPEVAWAMCPKTEDVSVVWTEEMAAAFGAARPLILDGDLIAARMAFRESYSSNLKLARAEARPVRWIVSLGWDKSDRVRSLSDAIQTKRITAQHAFGLLDAKQQEELLLQLPAPERKRLAGDVKPNPALNGFQESLMAVREHATMPIHPERTDEERTEHRKAVLRQARQIVERKVGHALTDDEYHAELARVREAQFTKDSV